MRPEVVRVFFRMRQLTPLTVRRVSGRHERKVAYNDLDVRANTWKLHVAQNC